MSALRCVDCDCVLHEGEELRCDGCDYWHQKVRADTAERERDEARAALHEENRRCSRKHQALIHAVGYVALTGEVPAWMSGAISDMPRALDAAEGETIIPAPNMGLRGPSVALDKALTPLADLLDAEKKKDPGDGNE